MPFDELSSGDEVMKDRGITVVIETIEIVTGTSDWTGIHMCDYGRCSIGMGTGTPLSDKGGRSNRAVPSECVPLVMSADAAAKELGCPLHLIDVGSLGMVAKLKHKMSSLPVPRVQIEDEYIAGSPTTAQIVAFYHAVHGADKQPKMMFEITPVREDFVESDIVRE